MFKQLPLLFSGIFAAGILAFAVYVPQTDGSDEGKEAVIMQAVLKNLERYHFAPTDINDDFSKESYLNYLDNIDGARLFFNQKDLKQLVMHEDKIDDQIKAGKFDFFNDAQLIVNENRKKVQTWYREILAKPFKLNRGDDFELRGEDSEWTADEKAQRAYWEDYLKRDAIRRVDDEIKKIEKDSTITEEPDLKAIEKEVRADLLETYDKWFTRIEKVKRSQRMSQYINSLTNMFDPHTSYYLPKDKENFDIRFSGRLEGIGATLQTDDDYTKVTSLVVGGPAWKGKQLKEDDIIIAVRQEDQNEAVDIKGMTIDDVVSKIRGKKGTKVILTVKKPTGEIEDITIERDIVVIDEKFARSLIIDGQNENEKIGYIYLPSFYADFQNPDGRFCSKDVDAEIKKLQNVGVDGIILDLRDNGGGSLADVVKMTGFFIPEGPVVQVQDRRNMTDVLRDTDERVQYNGPLAIMVNSGSASASEIIAAALQDYDRAVIVGSSSTFGKGTVQRFIDLDRTLRGFDEVKPLGTIKLTMQKFFRINGGSTQLRGVVPDIILPDAFSLLESGEKKQEHAMEWTKIAPVEYEQNTFRISNMDALKKRSAERVSNNPTFALVEENAVRFKHIRDRNTFPLSIPAYQARKASDEEEAKKFKGIFKAEVNHGVRNLEVDLPTFEADESKQARNEAFLKDVKRDVYIQETINIVHDLIATRGGMSATDKE